VLCSTDPAIAPLATSALNSFCTSTKLKSLTKLTVGASGESCKSFWITGCIVPLPETGSTLVNGLRNVIQAGPAAARDFRPPSAGEAGPRNELRGPGLFDVGSMSTQNGLCYCGNIKLTSATAFGNFLSTLSKPRVMELSLRFAF